MQREPQTRQRHGVSRGVLIDHCSVNAAPQLYAAAPAPSLSKSAYIVPIEGTTATGTKLPPYGKEVENTIAGGMTTNVYLFAAHDAWERARHRHKTRGPGSALLLPHGGDPAAYRWPIVPNGVFVAAEGQPRERVFKLAQAVVSHGTPMAFAVYGNGDALIVRSSDWRRAGSERAA